VPSPVLPPPPPDSRLLRLAGRLALWALGMLVVVVLLGIAGWKGFTAFAFVVALILAVGAGIVFALAALLSLRP